MKTAILLILTVPLLFILLFLCSCDTILNSPKKELDILTNEPCSVAVNNDTLRSNDLHHYFLIKRSKEPLHISAFNDNREKSVDVKSRNSFEYWLNLYPAPFCIGFLIDKNNVRRYTYPKTIFIDIKSKENQYLTYKPLDSILSKHHNIIKITPLKTLDLVNSGLEISYERKWSRAFSTQLMYSYLFPNPRDQNSAFNIKGFRISIEEKYYFRKSAPIGPYISLEGNYLNNRYHDMAYFGTKYIDLNPQSYSNYPDTFGIKKQTFSFNLKAGYQLSIHRFLFDFYAGLGPRYKDVQHFDRIKPDDEMEMPRHPNIYYLSDLKGKYWTISIPLNFRIGWSF